MEGKVIKVTSCEGRVQKFFEIVGTVMNTVKMNVVVCSNLLRCLRNWYNISGLDEKE